MKFCVLGSGSKGNCTLIESAETRILIDCGFSGKEIEKRLVSIGYDPQTISAILVTHEHNDHIAGVGVLSRRYQLPVFANPATYNAAQKKLGRLFDFNPFSTGEPFRYNDLYIHPFAVSHDTADPVGFVCADEDHRVGYCTDTGRITKLIAHHLRSCHALILEANHDPYMLKNGPYPLALQQRIRSSTGHLANRDALNFVAELIENGLQQLVLAHMSDTNNHPDVLVEEVSRFQNTFGSLQVHLASQDKPGGVITL